MNAQGDHWLKKYMETPEKRVRFYFLILAAQISSIALIVIGGIVFILWAIGRI